MNNIALLKVFILFIVIFWLYRFGILIGFIRKMKPEKLSGESEKKKLQLETLEKRRNDIVAILEKVGKAFSKENYSFELFEKSMTRLKVRLFERKLNAYQYKGFLYLLSIASTIAGVLWVIMFGFSMLAGVLCSAGLLGIFGYQSVINIIVRQRDALLEENFSEIYLIIYSAIIDDKGAPIVEALKTFVRANEYKLDIKKGNELERVKEQMNFVDNYMALCEQYPEVTATRKMRDIYGTSALIVNFCTVVEQRLRGKDNVKKLDAFKQELFNKKSRLLDRKNEVAINRASVVINLIYIILIQQILLAAIGGLPLDSMFNINLGIM